MHVCQTFMHVDPHAYHSSVFYEHNVYTHSHRHIFKLYSNMRPSCGGIFSIPTLRKLTGFCVAFGCGQSVHGLLGTGAAVQPAWQWLRWDDNMSASHFKSMPNGQPNQPMVELAFLAGCVCSCLVPTPCHPGNVYHIVLARHTLPLVGNPRICRDKPTMPEDSWLILAIANQKS